MMSREVTVSELRDRFEREYTKLIPNEDQATPTQIRKAATEVARKLDIDFKLKLRCTRPPGGKLKCQLEFELDITTK